MNAKKLDKAISYLEETGRIVVIDNKQKTKMPTKYLDFCL